MFRKQLGFLVVLILSGVTAPAFSETILFEGVLGNSGEQGATLIKMGTPFKGWVGFGVVCDKHRTLWDRTSLNALSHLSVDGRLLGEYPLPETGHPDNQLAVVDNDLVIKLGGIGLLTLSIDAPPGTAPHPMKDEGIAFISSGSHDGKLAAVDKTGRLLLLRPADGSVEVIGATPGAYAVEMTPDGTIYTHWQQKMHKYVHGREVTDSWPRGYPTCQHVNGYWYTFGYHTTIGRYTAEFQPDPGVVLGGASGSFIGFLEGNWENHHPRGLAQITPELFAVSSNEGVPHILRWLPEKKRFEFVRRIGGLLGCSGLVLDRAGNIRCEFGSWHWDDLPDAPQRFSAGWLHPPALTENDTLVSVHLGPSETVFSRGNIMSYPQNQWVPRIESLKAIVGSVIYRRGQDDLLLLMNTSGQGQHIRIGSRGEFINVGTLSTLHSKDSVKEWSSLTRRDDSSLIGAANGRVVELIPDSNNWKEARSWNSWGSQPDEKFGNQIQLAADDRLLWVADSSRHRVLCFSSDGKKLLASFGQTDTPGNDLDHVHTPLSIAARGDRAVVYDSTNRRLIKLRLAHPDKAGEKLSPGNAKKKAKKGTPP